MENENWLCMISRQKNKDAPSEGPNEQVVTALETLATKPLERYGDGGTRSPSPTTSASLSVQSVIRLEKPEDREASSKVSESVGGAENKEESAKQQCNNEGTGPQFRKESEEEDRAEKMFPYIAETNRLVRSTLAGARRYGEIAYQKNMMKAIRQYIHFCRDEYETAVESTLKCRKLARSLARTMDLMQSVSKTFLDTYEYMYRMGELVAIYISCELIYAREFKEHKDMIANRISHVMYRHLKVKDPKVTKTNILRMFVLIPKLYRERVVMNKVFEHFIPSSELIIQNELPDKMFIQYIVLFYQWKELQATAEEQMRIISLANRFMRPAKTLATNSTYAFFLPRYSTRLHATKFILENLRYFKDLQNASIYDNCLQNEKDIIDVSEDESLESSPESNFADVYASTTTSTIPRPPKFEHPVVCGNVDLTLDDENDGADSAWIADMKQKALKSAPTDVASIMRMMRSQQQNNVVTNNADIIDLSSDSEENDRHAGGRADNQNTEPELFTLDFESPERLVRMQNYDDVSDFEDLSLDDVGMPIGADPTKDPRALQRFFRTYAAPKEKQSRHRNDSNKSSKMISDASTQASGNSSLYDTSMPNTSGKLMSPETNYRNNKQSGCDSVSPTGNSVNMPRIINSFSCRRDNIHLPRASSTSYNQASPTDEDMYEEQYLDALKLKTSSQHSKKYQSCGPYLPNASSYERLRTTDNIHAMENNIKHLTKLSSPNRDSKYVQSKGSIKKSKKPVEKHVQFNEVPIGPTRLHSATQVAAPVKPAISRRGYPQSAAATSPAAYNQPSPASSTTTSDCSVKIKQRAEKEHREAFQAVFSSYELQKDNKKQPKKRLPPLTIPQQPLPKMRKGQNERSIDTIFSLQTQLMSSETSISSGTQLQAVPARHNLQDENNKHQHQEQPPPQQQQQQKQQEQHKQQAQHQQHQHQQHQHQQHQQQQHQQQQHHQQQHQQQQQQQQHQQYEQMQQHQQPQQHEQKKQSGRNVVGRSGINDHNNAAFINNLLEIQRQKIQQRKLERQLARMQDRQDQIERNHEEVATVLNSRARSLKRKVPKPREGLRSYVSRISQAAEVDIMPVRRKVEVKGMMCDVPLANSPSLVSTVSAIAPPSPNAPKLLSMIRPVKVRIKRENIKGSKWCAPPAEASTRSTRNDVKNVAEKKNDTFVLQKFCNLEMEKVKANPLNSYAKQEGTAKFAKPSNKLQQIPQPESQRADGQKQQSPEPTSQDTGTVFLQCQELQRQVDNLQNQVEESLIASYAKAAKNLKRPGKVNTALQVDSIENNADEEDFYMGGVGGGQMPNMNVGVCKDTETTLEKLKAHLFAMSNDSQEEDVPSGGIMPNSCIHRDRENSVSISSMHSKVGISVNVNEPEKAVVDMQKLHASCELTGNLKKSQRFRKRAKNMHRKPKSLTCLRRNANRDLNENEQTRKSANETEVLERTFQETAERVSTEAVMQKRYGFNSPSLLALGTVPSVPGHNEMVQTQMAWQVLHASAGHVTTTVTNQAPVPTQLELSNENAAATSSLTMLANTAATTAPIPPRIGFKDISAACTSQRSSIPTTTTLTPVSEVADSQLVGSRVTKSATPTRSCPTFGTLVQFTEIVKVATTTTCHMPAAGPTGAVPTYLLNNDNGELSISSDATFPLDHPSSGVMVVNADQNKRLRSSLDLKNRTPSDTSQKQTSSALSSSDYEVSSTQDTADDVGIANLKLRAVSPVSSLKNRMGVPNDNTTLSVQNSQVGSSNHGKRRTRLSSFHRTVYTDTSASDMSLGHRRNRKRRKTICSEFPTDRSAHEVKVPPVVVFSLGNNKLKLSSSVSTTTDGEMDDGRYDRDKSKKGNSQDSSGATHNANFHPKNSPPPSTRRKCVKPLERIKVTQKANMKEQTKTASNMDIVRSELSEKRLRAAKSSGALRQKSHISYGTFYSAVSDPKVKNLPNNQVNSSECLEAARRPNHGSLYPKLSIVCRCK